MTADEPTRAAPGLPGDPPAEALGNSSQDRATPPLPPPIALRPFRPRDQEAARALILAGLAEHWGTLDPALNPDLDDIAATYAGATFLVARQVTSPAAPQGAAAGQGGEGRLVGTGALVRRDATTAEIVRMSVAADVRRRSIGRRILNRLLELARQQGFRRVILETTATWQGVIAFYLDAGFRITHYAGGDVYFELDLTTPQKPGPRQDSSLKEETP